MKSSESLYTQDPQTREYIFPDVLAFDKEPFATVIPYRSPSFKVHKTEGLANSALSHHKQGAKYELVNGVWTKRWEFKEPDNCEVCGVGLSDRDRTKTHYAYQKGTRLRSPIHKGSAIFAPYLCLECYKGETAIAEEKQKARQWQAEQKRRKMFDAINKI